MAQDRAHEAEALRRRARTETGRSPAQRTKRSRNKGRETKRPGKATRNNWRREQ